MVYIEDEEANLKNVGLKDHLSNMDNIAGVHLATPDEKEIIVITPVLSHVDEHAVVTRLNLRRCNRTKGDCE